MLDHQCPRKLALVLLLIREQMETQNLFSQMGSMMGASGDQNPLAMFSQMAQQMHHQKREQMRNEMNTQSNPTRDRLKKKLADKKKEN